MERWKLFFGERTLTRVLINETSLHLFTRMVSAQSNPLVHYVSRYIVECNPDVQPPAYLQISDEYDLSSVAHPDHEHTMQPFHSMEAQAWPRKEELGLDESQMRAFQLALTKELTIIQGPPGTGETSKRHRWKDDFLDM